MDQSTMSRDGRFPLNSRVCRRLDFGGDNFEAEVENFINVTNETVQMQTKKYNFDFTEEIALLGRFLWSKRHTGVGWVTMEVTGGAANSNAIANARAAELTATNSSAAAANAAELIPMNPKTAADVAELTPKISKAAADDDESTPTNSSAAAADAAELTPMNSKTAADAAVLTPKKSRAAADDDELTPTNSSAAAADAAELTPPPSKKMKMPSDDEKKPLRYRWKRYGMWKY